MRTIAGRVAEVQLHLGEASALIACQAELVPTAGQYLLAIDENSIQATPLFLADAWSQGFLAAPPFPGSWLPGTSLTLYGPLGHGFHLPMDLETGEVDEKAWKRWLRHDPIHMIEKKAVQENLRSMKGVFIDCGFKDQYHLQYGSRILHRKLKDLKIRHHYEEFDDNHSSIDYRMDVSLPWLYRALR